ncbi:hypothetical protein B0T18DRAFT_425259 [Schizothecium vesticola]|uniref:Uncharacterized protein n=1 Tax=Schizothecium vesticola TaxID=314040 RepID=A0AA40FC27_9PEZI|nr:hypothetical protein B0T18DRAFT_425259 [Schizothecium vesticola]
MAPVRISIVQRDTTSPDPPKLDTGVIIGIACGIGALFLGSFVLFFIYWRRTRQCELEDTFEPHDLEENPFAASSPPAFTLDYKQSDEKHATASYPVSPSLLRTDTRRLSPVGGLVSAMPIHPAYIPRTVIRGSTPQLSRTLTPTTEEPENLTPRSQTALLPAAPPPARARSKSRPADAVVQAYLYAAEGERVPSSLFRHATAASSRDSSPVPPRSNSSQSTTTRALPLRTTSLARPQLQITTTRTRPPRSPPRLNLEMGLERRPIALRDPPPPPPPQAGRSITKPLAVLPLEMQQQQPPAPPPQQSYYYPEPVEDEPPSEDHRAFRDRADMVIAAVEAPGAGRRQYHHHHRRESSSTSRRIGDWIANSSRGQQQQQQPPPPPSAGDGRLWS